MARSINGPLQVVVSVQHARTKSRCIRAQRDAITYYSPDDATLGDVLRQTILADKPCPACGNVRGIRYIGIPLNRFICVAAGVGNIFTWMYCCSISVLCCRFGFRYCDLYAVE
jgi:hypothetical protein